MSESRGSLIDQLTGALHPFKFLCQARHYRDCRTHHVAATMVQSRCVPSAHDLAMRTSPRVRQPRVRRSDTKVDDATFEHERTHTGSFAMVRGQINSARGGEVILGSLSYVCLSCHLESQNSPHLPGNMLFSIPSRCCYSACETWKSIESCAARGREETCTHSLFVRLHLRKRRTRKRPGHQVVIGEVNSDSVRPKPIWTGLCSGACRSSPVVLSLE